MEGFFFFFLRLTGLKKHSFLKRRVFTASANPGPLRSTAHSCAIFARKIPPKYLRIIFSSKYSGPGPISYDAGGFIHRDFSLLGCV